MNVSETNVHLMREAIAVARSAEREGEVPVGAVVAVGGEIVARGRNRVEADRDPTAHAELVAIRAACAALDRKWLTGATLVVTLEPCAMCAGAIVLARLDRLVFGATDPKAGAIGSRYRIGVDGRLNHTVDTVGGVLADECGAMLTGFFRGRRGR